MNAKEGNDFPPRAQLLANIYSGAETLNPAAA